jgi:hypothetical protein
MRQPAFLECRRSPPSAPLETTYPFVSRMIQDGAAAR